MCVVVAIAIAARSPDNANMFHATPTCMHKHKDCDRMHAAHVETLVVGAIKTRVIVHAPTRFSYVSAPLSCVVVVVVVVAVATERQSKDDAMTTNDTQIDDPYRACGIAHQRVATRNDCSAAPPVRSTGFAIQ